MASDKPSDIPCPFLRALDRDGLLGEHVPIGPFVDLALTAFAATGATALRLRVGLPAVAAVSNGLGSAPRDIHEGFRPWELRGGPLDKHGGGSRILSQTGEFDEVEFQRFESFGALYGDPPELGWRLPDIERYMDANQARNRAEGRDSGFVERHVLMEAELPTLLLLLAKGEDDGRYMAADEVRALYRDSVFPERVEARIRA